MSKRHSKKMFMLSLLIGGTVFTQMLLYTVSLLAGWDLRFNLVTVCHSVVKAFGLTFLKYFLDALVFSTLLFMAVKLFVHWIQTLRMKKRFTLYQHSVLTTEISARYGADIRIISYPAPVAVTMGLFHPVIILSTGLKEMMSGAEFEAVIYHELYHSQSRDPLKILAVTVFASVIWYVPILKWIKEQYKTAKELLADEYAIKQVGSPVHLGSALLKMLKMGRQVNMPVSFVSFADTSVNARIHYLLDPLSERPLTVPVKSAIVSLSIFFTICLLFLYAFS